jgi:undecaprenyl-diphosphatase
LDIVTAAFLGLLQGLTEWFPVSSSGHLVLAQTFLGIGGGDEAVFFDVILHVASMLVVIIIFRTDILKILTSFIGIFTEMKKGQKFKNTLKEDPYKRFALLIFVATIPTVIIGYVFQKWFESFFAEPLVVAIALAFTGAVLIMTWGLNGRKTIEDMDSKDALFVGTIQGIAIIPGVSRSGSTISTGMILGIDRNTAARFSFILAIPAILGALVLEIGKAPHVGFALILPFAIGFVVAFVVGYATLKAVMYIIKKQSFHMFAFYCWGLAGIVLTWIYILK